MPKVSVIIPIYGVEKYIERCSRSLFEQTLDDLEYIFVNDCTPDRSINILEEILEQYPHRKKQTIIYNMPTNSGQAAVRQYGIQFATGEYIIHCDSDDWVDIHAYEKMYSKAVEGDYDVVFCDFYTSNGIIHKKNKRKFKSFSKEDIILTVVKRIYWQLWGAMIKRNILTENTIYYPIANNGEDFALILQLLYYSNKFTHIKLPLYYYYQNENSITRINEVKNYINRALAAKKNTELIIKFFKSKKVEHKYFDVIIMLKLYTRRTLSYITHTTEYRKIWYTIFAELEQDSILFNINIPIKLKINYFSIKTKTYTLFKKIQHFLKMENPI